MAASFADLKTRIADDINRSDLSTQIDTYLRRAVEHYERRRWWFNEGMATFSASTSQDRYTLSALVSDLLVPNTLELTRGSGNKVRLGLMTWERYLDDWRFSTTSLGEPVQWAIYGGMLWLGPVPGLGYELTISYVKTLGSFSDGTSNEWTTYADELLCARTEKMLGVRVLGYQATQLLGLERMEAQGLYQLGALSEQYLGIGGPPRPWT